MTMDELEKEDFIRNGRLFRHVTGDELDEVLSCAEWEAVEPGEIIFQRGERAPSFFLVGEGTVVLQKEGNGSVRPSVVVGKGEAFGAVSALSDHPRTSTAKAESDRNAVLLKIDAEGLKNRFSKRPTLAHKMMKPALKKAAEQMEIASDMIDSLLNRS